MFRALGKLAKVGLVAGVILGIGGLAAFAVAGESRSKAVVHQLHGKVLDSIDERIEDPQALRAQLRAMEKEYPERIAELRGELGELEHEMNELVREAAISERVVALVDEDLERMESQLASQREGGLVPAGGLVVVDDRTLSTDRAELRLAQLRQQRLLYQNRAADARHDLGYLETQASRLQELLARLEGERAEFQTQIAILSRQIEAIERNDRLIALLEDRNKTIEECSRYEAISLDKLTSRLTQIRTRQEAELDHLAQREVASDYEGIARMQISLEQRDGDGAEGLRPAVGPAAVRIR